MDQPNNPGVPNLVPISDGNWEGIFSTSLISLGLDILYLFILPFRFDF
jgi:hypothetical protein